MSLESLFRTASYGLIGSGFAALVSTGGLDSISVLLYMAAFVGSWFAGTRKLVKRHPTWPSWAFRLYFLFYGLDILVLSNDFLMATVHLVLFTSALKLFTLKSDRDYVFLFLISFTELLAASTLTISISFLVTLSLFLLASVSTLILFEIKRSLSESPRTVMVRPTGAQTGFTLDVTRRFHVPVFFATALALTLLILVIALPIFFVLPRLQHSFLARDPSNTQFLSGFSNRVVLGEIGTIKKNNNVVMRVKLDGRPEDLPSDIKWRGIALDHYDGKVWSQSESGREPLEKSFGRSYFEIERRPYRGRRLEQTIFLQPVNTNVLFALNRPMALSEEVDVSRQNLYQDRTGSLSRERYHTRKLRYTVWSDVYGPTPERLRQAPLPSSTDDPSVRACFEVPDLDPRIRVLAENLTAGLTNPYDKAHRIEQYLKNEYDYSLEMVAGAATTRDPLAAFLFETKRGHCEYFASAMVIMLRYIDIPSRIVNGFQAGEFNELGNDFIVRQSNAHSWVEVFFPGYSWVEFDPTPPDPIVPRQRWIAWVGKVVDAAELYWEEHFIRYNAWRQMRLVSGVRSLLVRTITEVTRAVLQAKSGVENRIMNWPSIWAEFSIWRILAGAAVVVGSVLIIFRWRQKLRFLFWRLRGRSERLKKAVVLDFYADMLQIMKKRGYRKPPWSTAREFAESLRELEVFDSVSALTDLYYRIRFRGDRATEAHIEQAGRLLRLIRGQGTMEVSSGTR